MDVVLPDEDSGDGGFSGKFNLESYTMATLKELREMAKRMKIKGYSKMKKGELERAIAQRSSSGAPQMEQPGSIAVPAPSATIPPRNLPMERRQRAQAAQLQDLERQLQNATKMLREAEEKRLRREQGYVEEKSTTDNKKVEKATQAYPAVDRGVGPGSSSRDSSFTGPDMGGYQRLHSSTAESRSEHRLQLPSSRTSSASGGIIVDGQATVPETSMTVGGRLDPIDKHKEAAKVDKAPEKLTPTEVVQEIVKEGEGARFAHQPDDDPPKTVSREHNVDTPTEIEQPPVEKSTEQQEHNKDGKKVRITTNPDTILGAGLLYGTRPAQGTYGWGALNPAGDRESLAAAHQELADKMGPGPAVPPQAFREPSNPVARGGGVSGIGGSGGRLRGGLVLSYGHTSMPSGGGLLGLPDPAKYPNYREVVGQQADRANADTTERGPPAGGAINTSVAEKNAGDDVNRSTDAAPREITRSSEKRVVVGSGWGRAEGLPNGQSMIPYNMKSDAVDGPFSLRAGLYHMRVPTSQGLQPK